MRTQKRERQRRKGKLNEQQKLANTKAKYGLAMKPSPVVVKSLETGEVLGVHDQSRFASRPAAAESLNAKAKEIGFVDYAAYLRSRHWRELREMVLARDGRRCTRCGARRRLQVHHRYYAALGAETMFSLRTLCAGCHKQKHA